MFDDRQEKSLFDTGRVVATPGAGAAMKEAGISPLTLLARHISGDWGELDPEDVKANEISLTPVGGRIFSAYDLPSKERIWVITEWDRSSTTFLLPQEY